MSQPDTAKINRKHIQRSVILVVVLGAAVYGFYWLLQNNRDQDPFLPPYNSIGQFAAIETKGDGSQAVIVKADGSILESPDYVQGANDHGITWRPDGNRVFFESDRYNGEPHVFRWNPDKQTVERKSIDKRAKSMLDFRAPGLTKPSATGLMIAGGTVLEINPNTGDTKQILPPTKKDAANNTQTDEGGEQSQMSAAYQRLGHSFIRAMWGYEKKIIVAVMRRDNGAEVLIFQDMTIPDAAPAPIATGDHIGFDVDKSGYIVFTVQGFQVPDWSKSDVEKYTKNGRLVPPFKHLIAIVDPTQPKSPQIVGLSPNEGPTSTIAFGDPVVSPDASFLALSIGTYANQVFQPKSLALMPYEPAGLQRASPLAVGIFTHVSWDATGQRLIALSSRRTGGHDIVSIGTKPNDVQNITNGKGDFLEVTPSPQVKAP